MNKIIDLKEKKCQPCEGIGKALEKNQAFELLKKLKDWQIDDQGKYISKKYVLKNFIEAVNMIQKIAQIAEGENHHPDIHLTNYKKLKIDLSTHALGGLSENDFIVAAKIDELTQGK